MQILRSLEFIGGSGVILAMIFSVCAYFLKQIWGDVRFTRDAVLTFKVVNEDLEKRMGNAEDEIKGFQKVRERVAQHSVEIANLNRSKR